MEKYANIFYENNLSSGWKMKVSETTQDCFEKWWSSVAIVSCIYTGWLTMADIHDG